MKILINSTPFQHDQIDINTAIAFDQVEAVGIGFIAFFCVSPLVTSLCAQRQPQTLGLSTYSVPGRTYWNLWLLIIIFHPHTPGPTLTVFGPTLTVFDNKKCSPLRMGIKSVQPREPYQMFLLSHVDFECIFPNSSAKGRGWNFFG